MSTLVFAVLSIPWTLSLAQDETAGPARTVTVTAGRTVPLKLRVAESTKNLVTVVTLPAAIAHVVSAWDAKDLSVEQEGNKLFLKLLGKVEGHLDVVTAEGAHYRLLVTPVQGPSPYDSSVLLEKAAPPADPSRKPARADGALELMKAMRLGEAPPDATVRPGGREVVFSSPDIDLSLLWTYETGRFRGHVLEVSNKSTSEAFHLDVARFRGERQVLIGSREVVVGPRGFTRLYLVEWK